MKTIVEFAAGPTTDEVMMLNMMLARGDVDVLESSEMLRTNTGKVVGIVYAVTDDAYADIQQSINHYL